MSLSAKHANLSLLPDGGGWINDGPPNLASDKVLEHVNPATGRATGLIKCAGAEIVGAACQAAQQASHSWRSLSANARRNMLLRIASIFEERAEEITALTVIENGSPIAFAGFISVQTPAEWFRYYAGWVDKEGGEVAPGMNEPGLNYSVRVPYGVIAVITAFNAPMSFIAMKVAAGLAAGNCVVIKPSERAPWTALLFARIAQEAGVPRGVVNVICGDADTAQRLVTHPAIDKITFTGGGTAGSHILAAAAPLLRPVSLELGGKSANILFDDCDIESAVGSAIFASVALLSGQACIAGTRLLVQRPIYATVVEAAASFASSLKVGDPFDPRTVLGPIISAGERIRIEEFIKTSASRGDGRVVLQGGRPGGDLADGFFLTPTIFADVERESALALDEIFGPVLSIMPFDTDDEGIAMANRSKYGLAAYAFTSSLSRATRAARELEAGSIAVNKLNAIPANMPFGGIKQSGMGREGGRDGFLEMTQCKSVQIAV